MPARLSQEEFIRRATNIHNGKYDYSDVVFMGTTTKVTIICPTHGMFQQTPMGHLSGRGCAKCACDSKATSSNLGTSTFIAKATEIHNGKYEYSNTEYKNNRVQVSITCPIHGEFTQIPKHHLKGSGCKACGYEASSFSGSYNKNTPGIFYYLEFPEINMWKIGVTSLSVPERFNSEKLEYIVINVITFPLVRDAYELEAKLLREFREYRYVGPKLLRTGSTELLTIDITEYLHNKVKELDV